MGHKIRENYYVHSCWDETKLWINSNLPQPTDFKNRLVASCGPKFERIFQTNPQQYIWDELSKGIVPFKFLSDLIQCTEESAYWIAAKVVYLKLDHGWSYLACNKCFTEVDQEENIYYCSKCNEEVISIIHRYDLQMYVTDGTAIISLLLGNREALQLIGKPAKELNEGLLENVECSYPSELDDLIEKKLMFKVRNKESNISKNDDVYKVIEFTNDETLLKKYCQPSIQVTLNDSSFDYGQSYGGDKHFEKTKAARRASIIDEELRQQRIREIGVGASSSVSTTDGVVRVDVNTIEGVETDAGTTEGDPIFNPAGFGKTDPPTC
uniref:Transposase n=1 Tax=Solanum tuberosum TaxID=4113 RepID=M1AA20_SOLTU